MVKGLKGKAERHFVSYKNQRRNWYGDSYYTILVQRNILLVLCFVVTIGVLLAVVTINQVFFSKSIEPFVVQIDDKAGVPVAVEQTEASIYTEDVAIQRYFVNKYVTAREGFSVYNYNYEYRTVVRLLSASRVYLDFRRYAYGPDGPVAKFGQGTQVSVHIKSVQYLAKDRIQIRIATRQMARGSAGSSGRPAVTKEEHKIIILHFQFATLDLTFAERLVNPLGFQVIYYQIDNEYL